MRLPPIYGHGRRLLVWRLLGYGLIHAGLSFSMALTLRSVLRSTESSNAHVGIVLFLVLSVAGFSVRVCEGRDAERLGQEYVLRLRSLILARLTGQSLRDSANQRWGVAMSRLVNDLSSLRNWVSLGFARAASGVVSLVGLLLAMAYFDRLLAVAATGVVLVLGAGACAITPGLIEKIHAARRQRGRLANEIGEKVLAAQTLQHMGGVQRELRRVRQISRDLRDELVARAARSNALRSLPDLLLGLVVAAALALPLAVGETRSAAFGASHGAVVVLLLGLLTRTLRDLARAWDYRLAFVVGSRKIQSLLEVPLLATSSQSAVGASVEQSRVRSRSALLRVQREPGDARFELRPGEWAVVVGPSGCGKSTLLHQLAGIEAVSAGEIFLDGRLFETISSAELRRSVRLASPAVPLLRGSVRRNLRYGSGDADPGWLETVVEMCSLNDASLFPQGLDTRISEGGADLSAGARARLSLARAFAARPRLLLVDDPYLLIDEGAGAALRQLAGRLRPTLVLVSPEGLSPIAPDQVWPLGREQVRPAPSAPEPRLPLPALRRSSACRGVAPLTNLG